MQQSRQAIEKPKPFGAAKNTGQRKELGKSLRKTNFNLGEQHKGNNATYYDHYRPPPMHFQSSMMDDCFIKAIRDSHFSIGEPGAKQNSATMTQTAFKGDQGGKQNLSVEVLSDLRRHHFTLGNHWNDTYQTTAANSFQPKFSTIDSKQDRQQKVAILRKHNFVFGSDPPSNLSVMKSAYKPLQSAQEHAMLHLKKDLRNSHFQFGNEPVAYQSVAQASYTQKNLENPQNKAQVCAELRATHFKLGCDAPVYQTTQQQQFYSKKGEVAMLNQEKKADLRKSHFHLGNQPLQFQTVAQESYRPLTSGEQFQAFAPKQDNVMLRKTNFILGSDNDPSMYRSAYSSQYQGRGGPQQEKEKQVMDTYALQKSNLVMGNDVPVYQSQNQSTYLLQQGKPCNLDPEKAKDLRTHHFKLGSDPNCYQTVNKNDFDFKKGEMAVLNQEKKADLRKSHFELGSYPVQLQSLMKQSYQGYGQNQGDGLKGDSVTLRKTNFKLGDNRGDWNTVYRLSMTDHTKDPRLYED